MTESLIVLLLEALGAYVLVLGAHALRFRVGLSLFYALLGAFTAVMSWVTDAGVVLHLPGVTLMTGSVVFYTALLLGVFVVYVFNGPRATRVAIVAVAGLSVLASVAAFVVRARASLWGVDALELVPVPSLRNNVASVLTAVADMLFLAVAWEFLGKSRLGAYLWIRAFLTLLGVLWVDGALFTAGAFAGRPEFAAVMAGTLAGRLVIALCAFPLLYGYLRWQQRRQGGRFEERPVLSIIKEIADIRVELGEAQLEIERRRQAEAEKAAAIANLEAALLRVQRLEGMLPVCSSCMRIRVESSSPEAPVRWMSLEDYLHEETPVQFSHGLCRECASRLYPDYVDEV